MKVSVFGLGFTGTVTAACLAELGHTVIGVDIDGARVQALAQGRSPVHTAGIDVLVNREMRAGRLSATQDLDAAVMDTDLSLICIGTDITHGAILDAAPLEALVDAIAASMARKDRFHSVVVRTTTTPGTIRGRLLPLIERATAGRVGDRFGLAGNPEFLREACAVADFRAPSRIVIGEIDPHTAQSLTTLYAGIHAPVLRTAVEIAEMSKLADNAWHGLKVAFANELGAICRTSGLDSHALMDIFCADTKLNLSSAYLQPGFAFGGSCLPKDIRAIADYGQRNGVAVPILSNLIASNERHLERIAAFVLASNKTRFAMLGLAFSSGTSDLRGSPYLKLVEFLRAQGCLVRAHDFSLESDRRTAIRTDRHGETPVAADLLVHDTTELLSWAEAFIVTANEPEYAALLCNLGREQLVLDFVGIKVPGEMKGKYSRFYGPGLPA